MHSNRRSGSLRHSGSGVAAVLRAVGACVAVTVGLGVTISPGVNAAPQSARTPAATERGLDLFVHVPPAGAGGDAIPIDLVALGFPTATGVTPIPNASVEATWDPESLLEPITQSVSSSGGLTKVRPPATPPPIVRGTTDAQGRATLSLAIPRGTQRSITLLVSVKTADRERVQEIPILRTSSESFDLFVSDGRVVPGSEVVAWALWTSKDRSRAVSKRAVEFVLTQGGVVRSRKAGTTDASGAAMTVISIPRDDEPGGRWTLTARATSGEGSRDDIEELRSSIELVAREETPGSPTLLANFDEQRVVAGGKARYRLRVRDASGEGIAKHVVWVWTGPKGTVAPVDIEAFQKVAQRFETDGAGEILADVTAPTTIPLRGTEVRLEARTEIEGLQRAAATTIDVGQRRGYATLTPEARELVPGLEQRLEIELWGDDDKPIVGTFSAQGDGLDATFTTNAHGEGEVTWKVPPGVGAARSTGPCPGSVAAQVTLRAKEDASAATKASFGGALVDTGGMALCVPVRRDGTALARPSKLVVREGESIPLTVLGADKKPASIVLTQDSGAQSTAAWTADAGAPNEIRIPKGAAGTLTMHVAIPKDGAASETVSTAVLVLPTRLPKIAGKLAGGRAVPGGKVTISAELTDETGKPMVGSVAAVVIDKLGGGTFGPLAAMDTRESLCRAMGAPRDRCDAALLGGPEMDVLRRSHLLPANAIGPVRDPSGNAKTHMDATFAAVVRSLEGAVFESSRALETLPDVRRKEGGKYVFNPELMTLVTDAMSEKPLTPGGEPVSLTDLIAIDPQITYDNVARRITRLKLFQVLSTVRGARVGMDPDEPIFDDPNVYLRKLVRENSITEADLLDPWGGQLSFFKGGTDYVPFVSVKKGWELRSPGPDAKMGTADDVKSPFERVLKSKTPYARAMDEDVVVDARYDMRVADSTVDAWSQTLLKATGTELGAGGLSLSGIGEGGGGRAEGIGLGSIGTVGHGSGSIAKGIAFVSAPIRTDAQGRVSIEIPLGGIETTWQVALVGLPDDGRPAVSTVDVPVTVPLSSKVNAGSSWTEGDSAESLIQVRNRTDADLDVSLAIATRGALTIGANDQKKTVKVSKRGVALVRIPLVAKGSGAGFVEVRTTAAGQPDDVLTHEVEVRPRGELIRIARTSWITSDSDLAPALQRPPFVAVGAADLILERGDKIALESALESLTPERAVSIDELADMAAAAGELRKHFIALEGDGSKLAARARDVGRSATAKLASTIEASHPMAFAWLGRATQSGLLDATEVTAKIADCPSELPNLAPSAFGPILDAEPTPTGGGVRDCWTVFVARAVNELEESGNAGDVARATLALARRPHRSQELKTLRERLEKMAEPDDKGHISVQANASRADRALVYAALLASTDPTKEQTKRAWLVSWLLVQRDANGSFGTVAATRGAIQALVRESSYRTGTATGVKVKVDFGDGGEQEISLDAGARKRLTVPANASEVTVETTGGGVMARLERTFLRPYDVAPEAGNSPVTLEVEWPTAPECTAELEKKNACFTELKQGRVGNMRVSVQGGVRASKASSSKAPSSKAVQERQTIDIRIPLPPGVGLADITPGVRQLQGALYIRYDGQSRETLTIPLRFTLAGTFTAREATARLREYEGDKAIARARPITVRQ